MKYFCFILILFFTSCQKKEFEKIITKNTYLVHFNYDHWHYDPLAHYPGTLDRVIHTENFDTIIEIEITTSNILNEKIEISGLKKFEKSEEFEKNITSPILTTDNQLIVPDYYLTDTLNGFLKDDSIYYHFSVKDHYTYNYTITGHKIE